MSRGPYKRRPRLKVRENGWRAGDIVQVGKVRWIIHHVNGAGDVQLESSNAMAPKRMLWETTLDLLPERPSR